jgi:hypothetical protein
LARYCSEGCQAEVRRWQIWRARLHYRQTESGKAARREQGKRRRARLKERDELAGEAHAPEQGAGVGHQDRQRSSFFSCARPGCYDLILFSAHTPLRRFCSCGCRNALRSVLLREARWKRRLAERANLRREKRGGRAEFE